MEERPNQKKGTKLPKKGPKRDQLFAKVPKRDFSGKKGPTWEHWFKTVKISKKAKIQAFLRSLKSNKQELMWTSDKLQWTDKHIQALKLEKIVLKSRFSPFFCEIGLILNNSALNSGNYWFSSGVEQLVLSEYAI